MSDEIQPKLNTAFEHVEAGRLEEAIALLNPILETAPDNADAWWIYAHAVSDPQEARRALANVLRIMPDYPGARDLQDILDRDFPAPPVRETPRPVIKSLASAPPPPPPPSMPEPPKSIPETARQSVDDADDFDDIFDQRDQPLVMEGEEGTRSPSRTSVLTIAIFAVVVAAIVLALILLNPGEETVPPTATTVAVIAPTSSPTPMVEAVITAEPTEEMIAQPTAEVTPEATSVVVVTTTPVPEVTPEITPEVASTSDPLEGLSELLSTFTLPDEAEERTEMVTLNDAEFTIVRICSNPGPEARALLRRAMSELAVEAQTLTGGRQGYGVRLINCADGTTLVATAALTEDAARFTSGELAETAFAATWQPFR
jgi:hypothetical protein